MEIRSNKILEFLGINSLIIFAFQEPVYRAVIFIYSKLLDNDMETLRNNFIWCIVIAITSIITIFPIIYCYNKWINPLFKRIKI